MTAVTIIDETTAGDAANELTLDFLDERITVRELIRSRVYQEVSEYNAAHSPYFRGLVQPTGSERTRHGFALRAWRQLDWEQQFERALTAFQTNGFVILVDNRQLESLDDEIELCRTSTISFLRLVPLVGG